MIVLCSCCARTAAWWDGERPLCCEHASRQADAGYGRLVPIEAGVIHRPERLRSIA